MPGFYATEIPAAPRRGRRLRRPREDHAHRRSRRSPYGDPGSVALVDAGDRRSVGGIPEVVIDGETGLLFPAEDEKGLADAIARLSRVGGAPRKNSARNGYDRAIAEFSPERTWESSSEKSSPTPARDYALDPSGQSTRTIVRKDSFRRWHGAVEPALRARRAGARNARAGSVVSCFELA